jgi:hypothetical protein
MLAEPDGEAFRVTLHAIREQTLERHTITMQRDGALHGSIETLASGLPLAYGA